MGQRWNTLQSIRSRIADSLRSALDSHAAYYNKKHKPRSYSIGEQVLQN
jgi:hypothetical protein